jgi:hypothetical protein
MILQFSGAFMCVGRSIVQESRVQFWLADFMRDSWWTKWQCSRRFSKFLRLSHTNHHSTIPSLN